MPRKRRGKANKEDPLIGAIRSAAAESELAKRGGKTGEECSFTDSGETATLETKSTLIKTPEEALKKANIDTSLWEIERQTVNSWEVAAFDKKAGGFVVQPLWQVKLSLRRRVAKKYTDAIDYLAERLSKKSLRPLKPAKPTGDCLYEPSVYDAHIGRYAWGEECGRDSDVESTTATYENAIADLLERAKGYQIARFLFPVGQDLFDVDNWANTTEKGTPQDVDTRFPRVYLHAFLSLQRAVLRMREIAPVDIVYVAGNHDRATSFYVCHALEQRFQQFEDVTVDMSAFPRKYYRWHASLIGITHGNEEKRQVLPDTMAKERQQDHAETTHHEWHVGHDHRISMLSFRDVEEINGTRIRALPSISAANAWTTRKAYNNAIRAAEGYLWNTEGYVGHFSVNARET